jgi:hypothetical protein
MRINVNKQKWLFMLLLIVLIVPARVAGVDQFATVDEPWWVISGSNFYYAITHREFANTSYDYHPAVTTMWVVTAGMVSYFPEYRIFNQKYFDVRKPQFENFMREKGKDSLPLVRNSRLIQIALLTFLALLGFFLLQMIMDEKAALFAVAFAMNAPFFMGNSRLLNHEAMLAMFSLICLLAMQVYLNKERRIVYLLVSGAMFGLAQLTKSSSIVLVPLIGLMLFVGLFKRNEEKWASKIWGAAKIFLIWLSAAAFIYVLLWPGMWVAPREMFSSVYGNAFSYALQGGRLDVTKELQPQNFEVAPGYQVAQGFINQYIHFSTPLSWLGLIFALLLFFRKDGDLIRAPMRSTLVYVFILAALFVVLFSIAQGRDSAHYVLTTYVGLDLIAGIGWAYLFLWMQKKWAGTSRAFFIPVMLVAVTAVQLGSSLLYYPYYYTYENPFFENGGVRGYGEGLDLAANYLAQKPGARDSYVIAYAGRGCFSYFYPGRTDHMKIGVRDGLPYVEALQDADYLVVYMIVQRGKDDGAELIRFLENISPEEIIRVDGVEYARIYKIADLPGDIYDILIRKP